MRRFVTDLHSNSLIGSCVKVALVIQEMCIDYLHICPGHTHAHAHTNKTRANTCTDNMQEMFHTFSNIIVIRSGINPKLIFLSLSLSLSLLLSSTQPLCSVKLDLIIPIKT